MSRLGKSAQIGSDSGGYTVSFYMTIYKTFFLSILLILLTPDVPTASPTADNESRVFGTVVDANDNPVAGATISILTPDEELLTGSATTDDGSFSIPLDPGEYILRVSFISYETHQQSITIREQEQLDVGQIQIREEDQQLDEVVIESEAADVEVRFDRRIYRADSDIEAIGGTALDFLETIPSLETDFEGNVSLRGSENVRVLINGRPSALLSGGTEALASIPSDNIERVEVITNPSARYDAQGDAGVINIVLKRNRAIGLHGSLSGRTGIPGDHRASSNINFMTNNANWFTNIGFRYRDRPSERNRFQRFESPDTSYAYSQNQDRVRTELRGDARVGAEVFLSDRQTLTPSLFVRLRDRDNRSDTFYRDMDLEGNLLREIFREDLEDSDRTNIEFDIAYDFDIGGTSNQKLTADFKIDFQPENEASDLREFNEITGENLARQRTNNQEQVTSMLASIDYVRGLGDAAEMELGARSSARIVDNQYLVEELEDNIWTPIQGFTDDFSYSENINAVYGILSGQFGKFSAQGGLRLEQTNIETELTLSEEQSSQNYLNLFPSMFVIYEFSDRTSAQVSYSRRLSRPRFRNILPFSNFRDSRDIFVGNPDLNPVFSNSYELSFLRLWESGSVSTSIYHRYRTGVVERITELQGDGVTRRFPINLSNQSNWGTELAVSQRVFDSVRLRGSANYFYSDTEGTYAGQLFERSTTAFFGRFRVQWQIIEGLNMQTTGFYS
ncbi:MAG: TonB-dependent receptor family protein, partial [Balneolales bacterium]|nr:TonB-dependent receptor family protein [Balneolales bacterium]